MIVDARLRNTITEKNDRFLLRNFSQRHHHGLQRDQFAVGVKGVVVGVVGGKRTARLRGAFRGAGQAVVEALARSRRKGREDGPQLGAVIGEIHIHLQVGGQRHHGDEIRRLHFRLDKLIRGVHGAIDLLRFHRTEVEEQHHQAPVAGLQSTLLRGTQQ